MSTDRLTKQSYIKQTSRVFILTELLSEPLWVMYNLLAFILRRDLGATSIQISMLATLKPLVALLSLYWSFTISDRKDRLRSNVFWAGFLGRLPFLMFFFVDSPWVIILAAAFFMLLKRGGLPAWMEIMKLNLPSECRGRIFSMGSSLAYVAGILLSIFIGGLLDRHALIWRWLFPITAVIGMVAVFRQRFLPINGVSLDRSLPVIWKGESSWKKRITTPWKMAYKLIREEPDFAHFQVGFMICGFALMLIMPVLPIFYIDYLKISYMDLAVAIGVFKGMGFALSSFYWPRILQKIKIYNTIAIVCILFAVFPLLAIFAQHHINYLYLAYLVYGVSQGGSHLCWNMSGPIFSHDNDSSMYSSVNILMVGLRGCLAPVLGGVLICIFAPKYILMGSMILSIIAAIYLFGYSFYKKMSKKFC